VALTPEQEVYCQQRASGAGVAVSIRNADRSLETATIWNRNPAIAARIDELQADARHRAMRILRAGAERAAERLTELIEPGYNLGKSASVNYQAALSVLKLIGIAEAQSISGPEGGPIKIYTDPIMGDV